MFSFFSAGDFIDSTLCYTLGFSTMCAAGIGNIVSDVFGLGAAGPIELGLKKLGIAGPKLSPAQLQVNILYCRFFY